MSWLSSLLGGGVPSKERQKLKRLENKISYRFKDQTLLKRSLTHKSFANEGHLSSLEQNERYEFLGDAVLELAISHLMMTCFPKDNEGDLSKLRAAVVNEKSLASLARKINLGEFLYLGRGEDQCQGREKDSLLSDAYEALLGAIYLDGGFDQASRFVHRQFKHFMNEAGSADIIKDYKTRLQEVSQDKFRAVPRYHLHSEVGPDHDKIFEVKLTIQEKIYGRGKGKSKKQAEQNAAKEALDNLQA